MTQVAFDQDYGVFRGEFNDPRTEEPSDEVLTADEALEQARDEFDAIPANLADWLAKVCDTEEGWQPIALAELHDPDSDMDRATTAQLVALLTAGTDQDACRARHVIKQRYRLACKGDIEARARELVFLSGGDADMIFGVQ